MSASFDGSAMREPKQTRNRSSIQADRERRVVELYEAADALFVMSGHPGIEGAAQSNWARSRLNRLIDAENSLAEEATRSGAIAKPYAAEHYALKLAGLNANRHRWIIGVLIDLAHFALREELHQIYELLAQLIEIAFLELSYIEHDDQA